MDLTLIQEQVRNGAYYWRKHAIRRSIERDVAEEEVVEVLLTGEIIEEYPEDKYGPSCLIYGRTQVGRPLHVQCSLPPTVWLITVYEPDPKEWSSGKIRKR